MVMMGPLPLSVIIPWFRTSSHVGPTTGDCPSQLDSLKRVREAGKFACVRVEKSKAPVAALGFCPRKQIFPPRALCSFAQTFVPSGISEARTASSCCSAFALEDMHRLGMGSSDPFLPLLYASPDLVGMRPAVRARLEVGGIFEVLRKSRPRTLLTGAARGQTSAADFLQGAKRVPQSDVPL